MSFEKQLYSIRDTQKILGGISRATLYRIVKDGRLKLVKVGSRSFCPNSSICAYLEEIGAA
jgi:hypothetical protein